jgi:hypothetical protein
VFETAGSTFLASFTGAVAAGCGTSLAGALFAGFAFTGIGSILNWRSNRSIRATTPWSLPSPPVITIRLTINSRINLGSPQLYLNWRYPYAQIESASAQVGHLDNFEVLPLNHHQQHQR